MDIWGFFSAQDAEIKLTLPQYPQWKKAGAEKAQAQVDKVLIDIIVLVHF